MPVAKIPLSALRVPAGKLAVALDMEGHDPMSIVVAATDLEDLVRRMDKAIRQSIGPRQAVQTHVQLRKSITLPMGEGGDGEKTPMMVTLLWLALNHPHHGDERVPDRRMQ